MRVEEGQDLDRQFGHEPMKSECHNPIFTPGISSGIGMQNEVAELSRVRSESGSNVSKSSQNMVGGLCC